MRFRVRALVALAFIAAVGGGAADAAAASFDFDAVRGVNYVPSWSPNGVATFQDYNASTVEAELSFAAASGFNTVRVFLHWLPWRVDAPRFTTTLAHLVGALAPRGLSAMLVVADSCFSNVTVGPDFISSGAYRTSAWVPNPGPGVVADAAGAWPQFDAFLAAVVAVVGASPAVVAWDAMNEPFNNGGSLSAAQVVAFAAHVAASLAAFDAATGRPITFGVEHSSEQLLLDSHASLLSFHNYNGANGGADLAADIAAQRTLALAQGKPLLLSEAMLRGPSQPDPLSSVLAATFGCFGFAGRGAGGGVGGWGGGVGGGAVGGAVGSVGGTAGGSVGWILWELMIRDTLAPLNASGLPPEQGLLLRAGDPAAGGAGGGGQWWSAEERALWARYASGGAVAGCPRPPPFVPDNASSLWTFAPVDFWTPVRGGAFPGGSLTFANRAGATAVAAAPQGSPAARSLTIVVKAGPDCGLFDVLLNGRLALSGVDSYSAEVDWTREVPVPLGPSSPLAPWVVAVVVRGEGSANSTGTYVQVVGIMVGLVERNAV
jgi:hypothetical protein